MPGTLVFFFFQAEDGIRDGTVTGVQTCALPIFTLERPLERDGGIDRDLEVVGCDIGAGSFETHGLVPYGEGAIPEKEGALQPDGGGLTPSSHEREPNCRDRRWQNAVYSDSNHPLAPTPGEPHAAPNKQERRRSTDRARFVVLPRPPRERRRAGE